jgi:antagonist of KipI
MLLEILKPGLLTTLQDLGRFGYQHAGIPTAGAMDPFALRAANFLVGNEPEAAVLEMTVLGPAVRFDEPAVIAVTGGDLGPRLDGREVECWRSCLVRSGATLDFSGRRTGARSYLAVSGGIDVKPWLGSCSTYLLAAVGGLEGRALRAGDRLPIGRRSLSTVGVAGRSLPVERRPAYSSRPTIRVILGPHADRFTDEGIDVFLTGIYEIASASNRIAYRLEGPKIVHTRGPDLISCGIALGGIQVPGNGQPILHMADHPTMGGYTLIAHVIQADIPLLAQCLPGDHLTFEIAGFEEARESLRRLLGGLQATDEEQQFTPSGPSSPESPASLTSLRPP